MIKIRKFKKYVALSATVLCVCIAAMMGMASAKGNTQNYTFSAGVSQNDSGYTSTGYHLKYNSSAVGIYATSCSGISSFVVQVYGAKNNRGEGATNCGSTMSRVVKAGSTCNYATTINGTNYTHVKLRIGGHTGYGTAGGSWKPDTAS